VCLEVGKVAARLAEMEASLKLIFLKFYIYNFSASGAIISTRQRGTFFPSDLVYIREISVPHQPVSGNRYLSCCVNLWKLMFLCLNRRDCYILSINMRGV